MAGASGTQTVAATDGRSLTIAEWGDPDGFPVFLLHGTPGSRFVGQAYTGAYASVGARVITYDRPGYGGSDRFRGRRVVDSVADVFRDRRLPRYRPFRRERRLLGRAAQPRGCRTSARAGDESRLYRRAQEFLARCIAAYPTVHPLVEQFRAVGVSRPVDLTDLGDRAFVLGVIEGWAAQVGEDELPTGITDLAEALRKE
jgi:pimeloyl-ACP methyl ester carboxylesterase